MSHPVIVTLAVVDGCLAARSRLGAHDGPEVFLAAPSTPDAPWWECDEAHELVLEALALLHLPRIDTLVFASDRSGAEAHERLRCRYAGTHVVRNTECRSQTLAVAVRQVLAH